MSRKRLLNILNKWRHLPKKKTLSTLKVKLRFAHIHLCFYRLKYNRFGSYNRVLVKKFKSGKSATSLNRDLNFIRKPCEQCWIVDTILQMHVYKYPKFRCFVKNIFLNEPMNKKYYILMINNLLGRQCKIYTCLNVYCFIFFYHCYSKFRQFTLFLPDRNTTTLKISDKWNHFIFFYAMEIIFSYLKW